MIIFQFEVSKRIVQGLVTPQRYIPGRSASSRLVSNFTDTQPGGTASKLPNESTHEDSSDSLSNESFVSAVGSQEDFTLVDLHMQVNRMILDSPMLMSSYVTHLTQVKCSNWCNVKQGDQFSQPLFEKSNENKLVYVGKFIFNEFSKMSYTKCFNFTEWYCLYSTYSNLLINRMND